MMDAVTDLGWFGQTGVGGPCHWKPAPGDQIGVPCRDCAHADVAHIGVEACVMCELAGLLEKFRHLLTPEGRRAEALRYGPPGIRRGA